MITDRLIEGGPLIEVQLYNGNFMCDHLSEATATTFCVNIFIVFNLRHGLIFCLLNVLRRVYEEPFLTS